MLTLGKTKYQRFEAIIVLIFFAGYALFKFDIISMGLNHGYDYEIPASDLNITKTEDLYRTLQDYEIKNDGFKEILDKVGITMDEYNESVDMELIYNHTQNGFEGIIIEFRSTIDKNRVKPVYDYIIDDVKKTIKELTTPLKTT